MARVAALSLTLTALVSLVSGCAGEDGHPGPAALTEYDEAENVEVDVEAPASDNPRVQATCTDGETRSCTIELAKQGSVENCFEGVSKCIAGSWSACQDPRHFDDEADDDEADDDEADDDERDHGDDDFDDDFDDDDEHDDDERDDDWQ